jgi:CheY-like chemotaxis protein
MIKFFNFILKNILTFSRKPNSYNDISGSKELPWLGNKNKSLSNILIIDDDTSCLSTLELLLKSYSYNVYKEDSGLSALEFLALHPTNVDLILLDLMMAGVNGFDILNTLEKDDSLKEIPIIIQSGIIDDDIRLKISNKSVKGFITKPYTKQQLISTIYSIAENCNTSQTSHNI